MTLPRRHVPGQVVMTTRRTVDRRFFLRPDRRINRIGMFELARSSVRHDVPIHGHVTMFNHTHTCLSDPNGERSLFMRDFCAGVARAGNHCRGRRGAFWDNRQYGDTVLLDRDAIERKLLYIWTNPVRAGFVRRAEDWPGAKILPRHWGKRRIVSAPQEGGYYDPKKAEFVVFTPQPPPGYEDMTLEEVIAYFEDLLRAEEARIAKSRRKRGRGFRTRKWVLTQRWQDCPKKSKRMMKLSPRFASLDGRLMAQAEKAWTTFQNTYPACRDAWRGGNREVVFPCGTLKLRLEACVNCRGPDPNDRTLMAH